MALTGRRSRWTEINSHASLPGAAVAANRAAFAFHLRADFFAALFNAGGSALSDASRHPASACRRLRAFAQALRFRRSCLHPILEVALAADPAQPGLFNGVRPARPGYYLAGSEKHACLNHYSGGHRQVRGDSVGHLFRRQAIFHWRLYPDRVDLHRVFNSRVLAWLDDDHRFFRQARLVARHPGSSMPTLPREPGSTWSIGSSI